MGRGTGLGGLLAPLRVPHPDDFLAREVFGEAGEVGGAGGGAMMWLEGNREQPRAKLLSSPPPSGLRYYGA